MKNTIRIIRVTLIAIGFLVLFGGIQLTAQTLRWLRVGQLQSFIVDYGSENELIPVSSNSFLWPAQYGDNQYTSRMKSLWMGSTNFQDPTDGKLHAVKVIGSGPRYDAASQPAMIFNRTIKLIGRKKSPLIIVDGVPASANDQYDVLDEVRPTLDCDRMVEVTFNTSIGVSVTKRVKAFTSQNHDNYYIYDYTFKNTGIYNAAGDVSPQKLNNFWAHFGYRYAFSGVTSSGWGSTWGDFASEWGTSTISNDFGPYRPLTTIAVPTTTDTLRGFYAFYGPDKARTVTYDQDWGCPNQNGGGTGLNGLLGSAKYAGTVTLYAPISAQNTADNPQQPATTSYFNTDDPIEAATVSQYDDAFMQLRWALMTEGHLPHSMEEDVGNQYAADFYSSHPSRYGGNQGQGYGPYTLATGDSIRIVFAEGVSGMSWEKCREVGAVWYEYYKGLSSPALVFPAGKTGSTYTDYTKAWVQTGKDSLLQTFRSARAMFRSGYKLPQPPDPPSSFTVTSGGDGIQLAWTSPVDPNNLVNGYVIYRSANDVKDYRTFYTKIFECNKSVAQYKDTTAARGVQYYYYIQSKDDGTRNELKHGTPLYSSLFLTMTSKPAFLLRRAGNLLNEVRVVPNPFDIRARKWQWSGVTGTTGGLDQISFFGIPGYCTLRIFTENGTLIWQKEHTDGSGDEKWNSQTSSGQVIVSGIYILLVEVTEDIIAKEDRLAWYDMYDENQNLEYHTGDIVYHAGDKIFSKGQSIIRKFVVIR